MITIYIRLLDEGTEVFRPTKAEVLEGNRFRVLATSDYDSDEEHWEFVPGSIVHGMNRKVGNKDVLIAIC